MLYILSVLSLLYSAYVRTFSNDDAGSHRAGTVQGLS